MPVFILDRWTRNELTQGMLVSDHLWISWNSTSYTVVLFWWRYWMGSVSWKKIVPRNRPLDWPIALATSKIIFSCESSWNQDNTYGLNIIIMQFKSLPLFLILCTYEIDLEHPFFLIGQNWLSAFLSKTSGQSQNLYSIWKRL